MRKFEYIIVKELGTFATKEQLNLLGAEGWEVAGTMIVPDETMENFYAVYTLKREIIQDVQPGVLMECKSQPTVTINIESLIKDGTWSKGEANLKEILLKVLTDCASLPIGATAPAVESKTKSRTKKSN